MHDDRPAVVAEYPHFSPAVFRHQCQGASPGYTVRPVLGIVAVLSVDIPIVRQFTLAYENEALLADAGSVKVIVPLAK